MTKYHEVRPGQYVPEAPACTSGPPHVELTADSSGRLYRITWNHRSALDYTVERDGPRPRFVGTASTMVAALKIVEAQ